MIDATTKRIFAENLLFTGIVQGVAEISSSTDNSGIRTFEITFPEGFCEGLEIGASVSVDGVCLTVTALSEENLASFDVMQQSLMVTTLSAFTAGSLVNVERAAKDGAEIGGHPLSGHIDFRAKIVEIARMDGNFRMRIGVDSQWLKYIFPKGYIAINGASLTIAEVNKQDGWFEVWLIPETLRMTTFGGKQSDDLLNIEIERETQVFVDTIRDTLQEHLGELLPVLETLLEERGKDLGMLAQREK